MAAIEVMQSRISGTSVSTTIVVPPRCSGVDVAVTLPLLTAPMKLVFDSIVAVPDASCGRFNMAHAPPAESATAMITPPWSTPPAVHSDGAQSREIATWSAEYASARMSSVAASGIS